MKEVPFSSLFAGLSAILPVRRRSIAWRTSGICFHLDGRQNPILLWPDSTLGGNEHRWHTGPARNSLRNVESLLGLVCAKEIFFVPVLPTSFGSAQSTTAQSGAQGGKGPLVGRASTAWTRRTYSMSVRQGNYI